MDDRPIGGRGGRARGRQLVHPGRERRLVLAGDHARGELTLDQLAADRGIEPVEADRQPGVLAAHSARSAERQAHGGVHRHREADRLGPLQGGGVPRLHAEVQAADLVPGAAQRGRRRRDVQRLVAQLVGGDQQDAHGRPTLARADRLGRVRLDPDPQAGVRDAQAALDRVRRSPRARTGSPGSGRRRAAEPPGGRGRS